LVNPYTFFRLRLIGIEADEQSQVVPEGTKLYISSWKKFTFFEGYL